MVNKIGENTNNEKIDKQTEDHKDASDHQTSSRKSISFGEEFNKISFSVRIFMLIHWLVMCIFAFRASISTVMNIKTTSCIQFTHGKMSSVFFSRTFRMDHFKICLE